MIWYRVVLECGGVPPDTGAEGAINITEAFIGPPWHQNVRGLWDGTHLTLTGENDFTRQELALDEFSEKDISFDKWRL